MALYSFSFSSAGRAATENLDQMSSSTENKVHMNEFGLLVHPLQNKARNCHYPESFSFRLLLPTLQHHYSTFLEGSPRTFPNIWYQPVTLHVSFHRLPFMHAIQPHEVHYIQVVCCIVCLLFKFVL